MNNKTFDFDKELDKIVELATTALTTKQTLREILVTPLIAMCNNRYNLGYDEGVASVKPVEDDKWLNPEDVSDFRKVQVTISAGNLSADEISRVSGCIGYAFRQHIRGEDLSEPEVIDNNSNSCILEYHYDTTKSQSDDPDFKLAFEDAKYYIHSGTPIRSTNRAGKNTRGTRLVEGLGYKNEPDIKFLVS